MIIFSDMAFIQINLYSRSPCSGKKANKCYYPDFNIYLFKNKKKN